MRQTGSTLQQLDLSSAGALPVTATGTCPALPGARLLPSPSSSTCPCWLRAFVSRRLLLLVLLYRGRGGPEPEGNRVREGGGGGLCCFAWEACCFV
ncbi:hypothetical protein ABZP36_016648 [Zizania latifolia]